MIPVEEAIRISTVARKHGIDPRLLLALRETENGRAGREFGVLGLGADADTWQEQAEVAARTIRHTISRFARALTLEWWDETGGRYSVAFLGYFSHGGPGYDGYAPLGAGNDPTNLNANHFRNLTTHYQAECAIPWVS